MAQQSEIWKVDGRELQVTKLDKIFWPDRGLTKGDLLRYYRDTAPLLLPYMRDRPFIMRVWPDGIEGKHFYRWRVPKHAPDWLERFDYHLQTADRSAEMAVVDDASELLWMANQGVIELHPWVAARQHPDRPTLLFFDLDPLSDIEADYKRVLKVAERIGLLLEEFDLQGFPKTSGGKGVHIFVALERRYSFGEVREWLSAFTKELERRYPGDVTSDKRLAGREGKILIDYSQNALGKSIIAPYSVRARRGAPISTPLRWSEVREGRVRPLDFTLTSIAERIAAEGDLFAGLLERRYRLPKLDR